MTSPEPPGPSAAARERWACRRRATLTGDADRDRNRSVWVNAVVWGELGGRPVLAGGGTDGAVRLWDPERGQELRTLTGPAPSAVNALVWGELGGRPVLASGGDDGAVRLWDPEQGQKLAALGGGTGRVLAVAWGQLGGRPVLAAGGDDGAVRLWDPELGRQLAALPGHVGPVWAVAWGELGGRPVLAAGLDDGAVRLLDPEQGQELRMLTGQTDRVRALAWGVLGGRPVLASGGTDGAVRLWDPERGQELRTLTGHAGSVLAVAWGQLGGRPVLASGGEPAAPMLLWDPEQGQELCTLTGHVDRNRIGSVDALVWGELGGRPVLASGGGDGTVRLWDPVIERFQDRLPGYRSDDPDDPDRLNRDAEAAALAEMITAQSARPPLAIGLFGDWGEGKTHFLRRIDDHVGKLAATARDDPDDHLTHSAVRQVHFNAWHYAETDLWASLVAELFRQLATPAEPGVSLADEQRRQSRLAAEVIARRGLQERLAGARARLDKLRSLSRPAGDSWERLPEDLRGDVEALAGGQPKRMYRSLAGAGWLASRQAALAWAVARRIRPWWWVLAAAAVAAAVLIAVFAAPAARWLSGLVAAAGVVGALAKPAHDAWEMISPVLARVGRWVDAQQARLDVAVNVAAQEVADLQRQLQNLSAGGQLAGLVAEQAQVGSYRSRLGLMTQIRTDFERMAELLAQASREPVTDEADDRLPAIDRIVVYIDDLDRCPPDRVVQVLEAVQLLLAVPLFVVVVAVDPRWLLRSLTVHYRKLFRAAKPATASRDSSWGSTPMQYLEKIFQIPFTLPPVDPTGYTTMVDALTATASPPDGTVPGSDASRPGSLPTPDPATADTASTVTSSPQARPQPLPAVPVVERFDPLALTDDERHLIGLLGPPLVTTPRSIKRLVNSYGLLNALRGSQHQQDLSETRHASTGSTYYPYRAGIALLGTLIAFPDLSPAFFPRLLQASSEPDAGSWPQFLKQMNPEHTADSWTSQLLGPLAAQAEALRWRRLVSALEELTADAHAAGLPLPEPLEAWAEWVVPAGRLSFETGRAVVTLSSLPAPGS